MNTKLFKYEVKDEDIEIKLGFTKLPMKNYPVSVTFAYIDGKLIADPWIDEEKVMSTRLTMSFDKDGFICSIQKGGPGTLSPSQIFEAANVAKEKAEELRTLVVKR